MMYDSVLHAENQIEKYKYSDVVINNMAVRYLPDELVAEIRNRKHDVQVFIKEAVEEKLKADKRSKS